MKSYALETALVISGWTPTCDNAHLLQLYSAVPLENQAAGTMTQVPTESHYPDGELASPCIVLVISTNRIGSDKY